MSMYMLVIDSRHDVRCCSLEYSCPLAQHAAGAHRRIEVGSRDWESSKRRMRGGRGGV